jgi:hypothetical protein
LGEVYPQTIFFMSQDSESLTNPTLIILNKINRLNPLFLDEQVILNNSMPTHFNQPNNSQQHSPKFSIGDEVVWAYVKAHDSGIVINRVWTTETVHKITGWHYHIRLHSNSSSYPFCKEDWAYEEDLELLADFTPAAG